MIRRRVARNAVDSDAASALANDMNTVRSNDGTTIAFDRSGSGPAVILIGGALSTRGSAAAVASRLASSFAVYVYDRRGRGDSGNTLPYSVEREIEDLGALIANAGGSAFVMGGSSGAILALEAAARGLAITRLAVYEPPLIIDEAGPLLPDGFAQQLAQLASSGHGGDAVAAFMTTALGIPAEAVAGMRQAHHWAGLEELAHTLAYDLIISGPVETGHREPLARWSSVKMPVLAMDGGASPAWMRNGVRALAETLPDSTHLTLEGQTHAADPAMLSSVLEEFFAGFRVG
jgi:pimeloyl-ACP methyl ester carboxylesterase